MSGIDSDLSDESSFESFRDCMIAKTEENEFHEAEGNLGI
jgi:hypothetical protein